MTHVRTGRLTATQHVHAAERVGVWRDAYPDKPVLGLEGLCALHVIVDQTEASALSTTELHSATVASETTSRKRIKLPARADEPVARAGTAYDVTVLWWASSANAL